MKDNFTEDSQKLVVGETLNLYTAFFGDFSELFSSFEGFPRNQVLKTNFMLTEIQILYDFSRH